MITYNRLINYQRREFRKWINAPISNTDGSINRLSKPGAKYVTLMEKQIKNWLTKKERKKNYRIIPRWADDSMPF